MLDLQYQYGFLTNYDETIFLRQRYNGGRGSSSTGQLCYRTTNERTTRILPAALWVRDTDWTPDTQKGWILSRRRHHQQTKTSFPPKTFVSTGGYSRDWWHNSAPISSAVAPPSDPA
ncbi:hypothetical protein N7519_007897 [Penicillium mononematosum]|uniref:uncharacterized protein n=1 Tax=Penicillium mononematosum TaxID=268346 RepID=UPI00254966D4|nr:uncharacterized protein N7519_007897 [Penicillium mononematosum]KAJ6186596.1 hypothetical protein N7519_007897 [Penicillium mononematosum]